MSGGGPVKQYKGYRMEALVLLGCAFFFGLILVVYWFWSKEHAGSVMLFMTVCLGALPGSYLFWWGWSKGGNMDPRPEDSDEAELEEGAGIVGSFPSTSIWPFCMGMSVATVCLALVFGVWLGILGGAGVVATLIGYTLESRRGGYI